MSAYMKTFAQKRDEDSGDWIDLGFKPFEQQQWYGLFGFLADVRNISVSSVLAEPRGWPADFWGEKPLFDFYGNARGSRYYDDPFGGGDGGHYSKSWFTMADLLEFDYDQMFENRRVRGRETAAPGDPEAQTLTLRAFLGEGYFDDLQTLQRLDCERVMVVFS